DRPGSCPKGRSGKVTIARQTPGPPARAPDARSSRRGSPAPAGQVPVPDPGPVPVPRMNEPLARRASTSLPGQLGPALDQPCRRLRVDGPGRAVHQCGQGTGTDRPEGRRRVGQNDRPDWPRVAREHPSQAIGTCLGPGDPQLAGVYPWQTEIVGTPDQFADRPRLDDAHPRWAVERHLVETVAAGDHNGPADRLGSRQDLGYQPGLVIAGNTDELMCGAGRVAERAHQVEDGPER